MISEHELLENGNKQQRCQVVRWVRTFPFSFLSKREYCIGRRMWRSQDGCLYGITKVTLPCLSYAKGNQGDHSASGSEVMPGSLLRVRGCCICRQGASLCRESGSMRRRIMCGDWMTQV